jgi:hypothetical protein
MTTIKAQAAGRVAWRAAKSAACLGAMALGFWFAILPDENLVALAAAHDIGLTPPICRAVAFAVCLLCRAAAESCDNSLNRWWPVRAADSGGET